MDVPSLLRVVHTGTDVVALAAIGDARSQRQCEIESALKPTLINVQSASAVTTYIGLLHLPHAY